VIALEPDPIDLEDIPLLPRVALSVRQFARARLANDEAPAISAPNVFMQHQRFTWVRNEVRMQQEIDIVFNEVVGARDPFAARLIQGAIDSILEHATMGGDASTANATTVDVAGGRDWTLLSSTDEARLASLDPDLRTRIESDLAAGYLVVVPTDTSNDHGWWRIDPSGRSLAMSFDGGGASMAEYGLTVLTDINWGICLGLIGGAIAGELPFSLAGVGCVMLGGVGTVVAAEVGMLHTGIGAAAVALFTGGLGVTGGGLVLGL
jgi:hypothetical protein